MTKRTTARRGAAEPVAKQAVNKEASHKHVRPHSWFALLVAAILALVIQGVEYWGWFAGPEGRILDLFLTWKPAAKHSMADAPVILIKIDDKAYDTCFGGTPPLDPKLVKQIVWSLVTGELAPGSRVLGVDIITDSPRAEYLETYRQIDSGLRDLHEAGKLVTPVVWAAGAGVANAGDSSFGGWVMGTEAELLVQPTRVLGIESARLPQRADDASSSSAWEWGLPVFPPDEDLRLRRFPREISVIFADERGSSERRQASWARTIAERFGAPKIAKNVHEVVLSYSIPFVAEYDLGSLYQCNSSGGGMNITPRDAPFRALKSLVDSYHAILLLGGTFTNGGDFHETSGGRKSGLEINARAIQAELAGNGIHEFPRFLMYLFDVLIGFLIGMIFELKGWRIRILLRASVGIVLVVAALSFVALWGGYVWLSCVGVAIGVNLHVIYEVYRMDLKTPTEEH